MNHRISLRQSLAVILLAFMAACTKIDSTTLGGELIPEVDNINTFAVELPVVANTYIVDDSTRLGVADAHPVGEIVNDPIFGRSRSALFFEMKPSSFPFRAHVKDSLVGNNVGFDSAVMVINYLGYYGDSSTPVHLKLFEVNKQMQADTLVRPIYNIRATSDLETLGINPAKLWGEKTVRANGFKDSVKIMRGDSLYETVVNQLRIPLDPIKAKALFDQDSIAGAPFSTDAFFKNYLPGFALVADGGPTNTLLYLSMVSSKIQFYYRQNPLSAKQDTTSSTITFNSLCGHAVNFERNSAGAEFMNHLTPDLVNGKDVVYIETTPGTAATIRIKGLDTLTNRVIHRAELKVTQLDVVNQGQLTPPNGLYLDIKTEGNIYKGVPYDLSPYSPYYCFPASGLNFGYFGGPLSYEKTTGSSDSLAVYRFNLTRYVQGIVTRGDNIYEMRLSAPFYNFYENCANGGTSYPQQVFVYSTAAGAAINPVGRGRVKLAGSGLGADPAKKMKLRIIYSKL